MSANLFGKDLSLITFADIQNLADTARAESETLEYKEIMPNKIDLQKSVLGFANNIGGYLIIGVRAKKPENTPEAIVGIAKEANMSERIVDIVRDNSSPQFVPKVRLVDLPSNSAKCVIVVYSHESFTAHRASDGRYYYRTVNETIPIRPEFVGKIIGKEKIGEKLIEIIYRLDWKNSPQRASMNVSGNCWLSVICCPIPPESFKLSLFSETEWYNKVAFEAIASAGSYDRRSTADSLKVFKIKGDGTPNAMIEYFENGTVIYCRILYSGSKQVDEQSVTADLSGFLSLLVKVYSKNSFDGGLLLVIGLGNIQGWTWTTGDFWERHRYDILPSDEQFLERRLETTVLELQSDINSAISRVLPQLRRNFNIH